VTTGGDFVLRRFAGNATWMLIAEAAGKLASFAFIVIVARGLGVTEFGYFTFAISYLALFLIFGKGALDGALVPMLARERERLPELFRSGIALRVALAVIALLVALPGALLLTDGREAHLSVAIIAVALVFDEFTSFLGVVFKAFERMRFLAVAVVTNRLLSMAMALAVVLSGGGLVAVCLSYLAGSFGALVVAIVSLARHFPPIPLAMPSRALVWQLGRAGLPLGLAGLLNMAVFRVDMVLLQALRGPDEVALYGVGYRLFESALFVTWSLSAVAMPSMSRAATGVGATRPFEVAGLVILSALVPLAVGAHFASEWLVGTLFSERYLDAAAAVPLLAAALIPYGLAHLCREGVIARGRRTPVAWIAGAVLAVNVAANAVVIPRHGFVGAAWTTLASETFGALLLFVLFVRVAATPRFRAMALLPLVAGGCMVAALLASDAHGSEAVLIGAAAYGVTFALAARFLYPDEMRRIRAAIDPRRLRSRALGA
jgi:O-antigen/teichoic acid export membrane protein